MVSPLYNTLPIINRNEQRIIIIIGVVIITSKSSGLVKPSAILLLVRETLPYFKY